MLNGAERRLVAEWIDLGGQYFNDPFDDANGDGLRALSEVRGVAAGLSESRFTEAVHPILMARCAACHQPFGGTGRPTEEANATFESSRFILTGSPEGDFNVTTTMVNDVCHPEVSYLLARPSSDESANPPHPRAVDPVAGGTPAVVLSATPGDPSNTDYQTIRDWIQAGCK